MLGKAIETIIAESTEITAIVSTRVFPISEYEKGLPAIYYLVECYPYYNKNGQQTQDWKLTLLTMHKGYKNSWELSMLLKEAFEKKVRRQVDGIKFSKIKCTKLRDDYEFNINSFGQTIEFDIKTQTLKASDV
jgi:hypothetical protein